MTQVFADDDQASPAVLIGFPMQRPAPTWGHEPALAPAMMPGKGVRVVRCIGCERDTLPRAGDGAPLCYRCCEMQADAGRPSRSGLSLRSWRRRAD